MPAITIIGGAPCVGKHELARSLAQVCDKGVHLCGDEFFNFLVNPINPAQSDGFDQNHTVITAIARAAVTYAMGGYEVLVDGVIGSWYVPVFIQECDQHVPLNYVWVQNTLEYCLSVAENRSDHPDYLSMLKVMHSRFLEHNEYTGHVVDLSMFSLGEAHQLCVKKLANGEFSIQ